MYSKLYPSTYLLYNTLYTVEYTIFNIFSENRSTARAGSWMHLAALFTALFILILIWWADILSWRRQTSPGHHKAEWTSAVDRESKKLKISIIFYIRKKKKKTKTKTHKRLTCKNIFYDQIPQEWQHVRYVQKTSIIYLYTLTSRPTKIYQRSSYWSIWGTRLPRFKYPSAVNVKTQKKKKKKRETVNKLKKP